ALLVGQLDEYGQPRPLVGAEVFLGEDVVEPADADVHPGPQQFRDQLGLLVRTQPAEPVPGFNHDDGAGLEAPVLGGRDQLAQPALFPMLVLVTRPAAVGVDFGQGRQVVPLAEPPEVVFLAVGGIALGLPGVGESAVADRGAARLSHADLWLNGVGGTQRYY